MLLSLLAAAVASSTNVDCATAVPAFMASYAADLQAGNRAAIAGRYSAGGAYSLGYEAKSFDSAAAIARRYTGAEWQKPDAFAWQALSVEQLGPGACLATGGFRWTQGAGSMDFAYTAVLRAEPAGLRILLEHENPLPKK
ncbi:hypothetical protein [Sphingomonas ginsengisoli (ex An et al. 2013)]|nr:hypothetical protein [Sphingomonas ginsengisoli An et al. 2013]